MDRISSTVLQSTPTNRIGMANLNDLKHALRQAAKATPRQPLSDAQYSAGFHPLAQGLRWTTYEDFVIPALSRLLNTHFGSRSDISVLEIGPGPHSILAHLSSGLRRRFKTYNAYEPNDLFATSLEMQLQSESKMQTKSPFPCLAHPANIRRNPFVLQDSTENCASSNVIDRSERYDLILFCYSMFGMKSKHKYIEKALQILVEQPQDGIVVVFHRDGNPFQDLVCHRTSSYPAGAVRIADKDDALDPFASFIAGYALEDTGEDKNTRKAWRDICRSLGRIENGHLSFSCPDVMVAFNQHASSLQELTAQVCSPERDRKIKNRQARLQSPGSIVKPTNLRQVVACVQWALKYGFSLTVIGGSHSGQCLVQNVVAIDMSAFDQVHIVKAENEGPEGRRDTLDASASWVVAEAGSTVGQIIQKTMAVGLTVPLGARPSVGAGLWLQGGIGRLARLHGLSCDAIVGAVIVSICSGEILCVGYTPSQQVPVGAVRPGNEVDLLWALRGAGTNCGIVISVTFKSHAARSYLTRNRNIPLGNEIKAEHQLHDFDMLVARKLSRECSADAYLYMNADQLQLGVTTFESSTTDFNSASPATIPEGVLLGSQDKIRVVDGMGLFETEMYMSGMHDGHGGGKTSSFKRCVFLRHIGKAEIARHLVAAMESPPSKLCYLHLLQGGGAIGDVEGKSTAFGCRDWEFACVITGVWPREQDGTAIARSVEQWVYHVAGSLLPLSCGAYGADLGPDPRDAALAVRAFGLNLSRLAQIKNSLDPYHVLAYACPLSPGQAPLPKLIILVTGESCAGKDYCAGIWATVLSGSTHQHVLARAVSISDATKREYAAATNTDLQRLLTDRAYKEQHRPALTTFFQNQVKQRPRLPEEHFLSVVHNAVGVDVLLITGMRDEAPVATLSHLVPESRLIEVHIQADDQIRHERRGIPADHAGGRHSEATHTDSKIVPSVNHCPTLMFQNNTAGTRTAEKFANRSFLPFLHQDLERLANMVRRVPHFPSPGIEFRHVLGISQRPGGLALCTSLLQNHFNGDWTNIGAIVCCEVGGFINASALALRVQVPLALIREAGKLPPPTISVAKIPSHISSAEPNGYKEKRIEMERDVVATNKPVVVIDDVLSTGETLCAVLELLQKGGVSTHDISIMVVAEFPVHRGRESLRRRGFGMISIQSLLVLTGA